MRSVSLVVSWFGDDLRCDRCTLRPAVEQAERRRRPDALAGLGHRRAARRRWSAALDGRPVFGGTPGGRLGAAGDRAHEGARAGGDVLSVHPDGHPGGQRAGRSLDRRGRPAARCRGGGASRCAGAGPAGVDRQDRGGGGGGGGVLRAGRGRRTSTLAASTVAYPGPAGVVVPAVHPALRASLRAGRRASMPSASARRCAA